MKRNELPVLIEWDEESKLYIGSVPGLKGAHTQAATLDELKVNMREVIELCLEETEKPGDDSLRESP